MSTRPACITGIGVVSPLGPDLSTSWEALLAGTVALETGADCLAEELRAYPVGRARWEEALEASSVDRRLARRMDTLTVQALVAAEQALQQAGLDSDLSACLPQTRAGVVLGIGYGASKSLLDLGRAVAGGRAHRLGPFSIPASMPNSAACNLAIAHQTRGPAWTIGTACAGGLDASGIALTLLQSGQCDLVLTGGSESIADDLGVGGMSAAKALVKAEDGDVRKLRPFDRARAGTVVGEGAAILVLETPEHAAARGAAVLAEVVGYGSGGDGFHITQPRADGSGAVDVMQRALRHAGMEPGRIGAVFAHGTGTPLNDAMEGRALREVFGARPPLVTSTKGQHGHAMGASGPLHLAFAMQALRSGAVPATVTCEDPDPECAITPVMERAAEVGIEAAMINAFGFGGHNASLIVRRA